MCESLGTTPDPADIPIEYGDLHYECRKALDCYQMLPSMWAGAGYYTGKDYTGIAAVFDLLEICGNKEEIMQMIFVIDGEVSADIAQKQKVATKAK